MSPAKGAALVGCLWAGCLTGCLETTADDAGQPLGRYCTSSLDCPAPLECIDMSSVFAPTEDGGAQGNGRLCTLRCTANSDCAAVELHAQCYPMDDAVYGLGNEVCIGDPPWQGFPGLLLFCPTGVQGDGGDVGFVEDDAGHLERCRVPDAG